MSATILADSINAATGDRITTFQIKLWKPLQAQLRTHRTFAQNHSSSRAIPTKKIIESIREDVFIPDWREHKKGMSGSNTLTPAQEHKAYLVWVAAAQAMIEFTEALEEIGIAKEQRNRLLEPFTVSDCIVSGSQYAFEHFFKLRCAEGVQPELQKVAIAMRTLYENSQPKILQVGEWHIPFEDKTVNSLLGRLKISAARCARTSYLNHEGKIDHQKDYQLFDGLVSEEHRTPTEHQFEAMPYKEMYKQFVGFKSLRSYIEDERLESIK